MTQGREGFLAVGQVVKAFGIRGEVIVRSFADSPARFHRLSTVHVGPDDRRTREMHVEEVHVGERGIRLKLKGIDDRTAAEEMRAAFLFVDSGQRVRLPKGRVFVHEIIGMNVVEQNGRQIGRIRDVLKLPAHDVYVIEGDGREVMIPAVQEFLLGIDMERRVVRVRVIEGMVEE